MAPNSINRNPNPAADDSSDRSTDGEVLDDWDSDSSPLDYSADISSDTDSYPSPPPLSPPSLAPLPFPSFVHVILNVNPDLQAIPSFYYYSAMYFGHMFLNPPPPVGENGEDSDNESDVDSDEESDEIESTDSNDPGDATDPEQ